MFKCLDQLSTMAHLRHHLAVLAALPLMTAAFIWPIPYKRYNSRPTADSFCEALYPFCPTGFKADYFPSVANNDTVEVFVLKAPVWEFRFGRLLADVDIIHDAIGFRSKLTGKNFTTEWYELFQLFNCTFPHILQDHDAPLWCNQGAACIYPGIDDIHWSQNGTLKKVAEMTGEQYNKLAQYIHWDNTTGLFYETWRVRNSTGTNYKQWFDPFDCASYVIRMFWEMNNLGAKFTSMGANYTFITLYSDMPQYLGNETTIFGPKGNKTLATKLTQFYSNFQAHQPLVSMAESLLRIIDYVYIEDEFYLYYNSEYWYLPMKKPHVKLSYEFVPFVKPKK